MPTSPTFNITPEGRRAIGGLLFAQVGLITESPEFEQVLYSRHAETLVTGGVRAGKSSVGAARMFLDIYIRQELTHQPGLFWVVGPNYPQTVEEIRYMAQWARRLGWKGVKYSAPQEGAHTLKIINPWGDIIVEAKSAVHEERLASKAPDRILVVEAGACSPDVRNYCIERALEKSAPIDYTGTLEPSDLNPQFAWYQEKADEWRDNPTFSHAAYPLPSWANKAIFSDCRVALKENPDLAAYCPDENHGEAHGGRLHPNIRRAEEELDPYTFAIRIAAEPVGIQYQLYPQLENRDKYLRPFDDVQNFTSAFGGIDWGSVHPTALAVVTFHPRQHVGIAGEYQYTAWVREVGYKTDRPDDINWLRVTKDYLSRKWNIPRMNWRTDPNERFMARTYEGVAVSGSARSRDSRIGLFGSRLDAGALYFDIDGPGVREAYEESRKVRRKKARSGEIVLDRINDDRTAAIEDALEGSDGEIRRGQASSMKRTYKQIVRRRELQRV
jgi:hypothetical protein